MKSSAFKEALLDISYSNLIARAGWRQWLNCFLFGYIHQVYSTTKKNHGTTSTDLIMNNEE